jgi:steroid delta-isomerase-like uncharacterized protein
MLMANEQNEAVSRKALECFNTGDTSVAGEVIADGAVNHDPAMPDSPGGPDSLKQAVEMYRGAFPDLKITIEEMFSDRDLVCTRWTSEGTNDGELMGMPPTGKHAMSTGLSIDKVQDGKIVESWTEWDNAGLMQQLGVGETAGAAAG